MRKVLLVVVLLVLIVGVSYVKTYWEQRQRETRYDQGFKEGAQTLDRTDREADSLRSALAQQHLVFADSLVDMEKSHRAEVDSLATIIDEKDKAISTLTSAPTSIASAEQIEPVSSQTISKHEEILRYYKKRFAELPQDLSEYEKRIAANEIREETSLKFAISLSELKEIRKKYKLSY